MDIQDLFSKKIEEIRPLPSELDQINQIVGKFSDIILSSNVPSEIKIKIIHPQGSTGIKQTSIRNDADIDLFIGIDPHLIHSQHIKSKKAQRKFLQSKFKNLNENWLMPLLKKNKIEDVILSYAEHPYLSAKYGDLDIDLVMYFVLTPQYLRENGPITAVDRTPHHTEFIKKHLTAQQRDEVRLLKYFFKCHHAYGDKSPIGRSGFIGYFAELLMVRFENIQNIFKNFDTLQNQIISFDYLPEYRSEEYQKLYSYIANKDANYSRIKKKKFPNDFLILLDPTDPSRNVGSSISPRAFYHILDYIKQFLHQPQMEFFQLKSLPLITQLSKDIPRGKLFYMLFKATEEDHYTKFRDKCYSFLNKAISMGNYEPTHQSMFKPVVGELVFDATTLHYCIAFHTPNSNIDENYMRKGPKDSDSIHAQKFKEKALSKMREIVAKDGFLWIKEKHTFSDFFTFLTSISEKQKIKKMELLKIGMAIDTEIPQLADESMGNLWKNIIEKKIF